MDRINGNKTAQIRKEFPFYQGPGKSFVYFDNAATAQKPQVVIDRLSHFYCFENANIHRGLYSLSYQASEAFERARETVREWIGAGTAEEIVFTKSSTEAVNLAASAVSGCMLKPGYSVVVTELEHSSNYYPWEQCCRHIGAVFKIAKARPDGSISAEDIMDAADSSTRLIAVTGMSNATGFMPELGKLIREAHRRKILVFVDATQLIVHRKISVMEMDCDLLCFSGHKLYAPMGTGVLYGKRELLYEMKPFLYGGDMVEKEDGGRISFRQDPGKYEAGTQNIAGVLGLETALLFLKEKNFETELVPYEERLSRYLAERMAEIPGIKRHGAAGQCPSIYNFSLEGCGAYDVGTFLAAKGIAVRAGGHCAYPMMKRLGLEASVRISLSFCNTEEEIDLLADSLSALSWNLRRNTEEGRNFQSNE
ncbi:MAG: cysteine desulfurase [Stomatobaculum sp.]|nr:cysteine desulfurase [Stomatobaculum sp.]